MTPFEHKSKLEESLKLTVEELIKNNQNIPLVMGHICWGQLSEKGSFRMSRTGSKDGHRLNGSRFNFTRHVHKFGRNRTFLDFLLLHWFSNEQITNLSVKKHFEFEVCSTNKHISFDAQRSRLIISDCLSNILLPISTIDQYIDYVVPLGNNSDLESNLFYNFIIEKINAHKYQALDFLNRNDIGDLQELSLTYTNTPEDLHYIYALSAIQSALIITKASYPELSTDFGFTSRGIALNDGTEHNIIDRPIIILSVPFSYSNSHKDLIRDETNNIADFVRNFKDEKCFLTSLLKIEKSVRDNSNMFDCYNINEEIKEALEPMLKVNKTTQWTQSIILWNAILIQSLRDSIHEGKSLDFTFVIADVSEITDSNLFELTRLDFETTDIFLPWNNEGKVLDEGFPKKIYPYLYDSDNKDNKENKDKEGKYDFNIKKFISLIKRNIEKKNYPWFQDGKYALLWDSTFPSMHPHSLIRIKNSSWNVFINEVRNKRGQEILNKIHLSLVFLKNDQSGGIIIQDQFISTFRKGSKWNIDIDEKEKRIKNAIENAISSWNSISKPFFYKLIDKMTEVISSISEDPHSGCILVLSQKKPPFENMGTPWRVVKESSYASKDKTINPLELSNDELVALMSMDGATCIYLEDKAPVIAFRNILMAGKDSHLRGFNKNELDGEGSRKWSSLIAARIPTIDLVITVSQDGPVYLYTIKDKKVDIEKLE
jgi:hypothetical protein